MFVDLFAILRDSFSLIFTYS